MKRCQESEPALISVIFFNSALPKQSEVPFVEKLERQENYPSIMLDKEGLDPHGIGNLLAGHSYYKKINCPLLESEEKLRVRVLVT